MKLDISPTFTLPHEAVTETFGILGVKGSGKTTTARVMVEEMSLINQQCVVIDPTGAWWGLRSSADGNDPGLPFTILGGEHADVPLTPQSGSLIADLVVDTSSSLVLDLSLMRKADQRRFVLAFIETLYHRNREALHLVVDECDLYVPQRIPSGQEPLVGAMEDIVRRGRKKGIGISLISQRPASVNKDVLSQVSVLVAHRLIGKHDRMAIDSWVEAQADFEQQKTMMNSIARLDTGEAWFWSPSFLKCFERAKVRKPTTFDSSATPLVGQKALEPRMLMPVDIKALEERMTAIIVEAESNDPKALKAKVARLEKALAAVPDVEHVREHSKELGYAAGFEDGKAQQIIPEWVVELSGKAVQEAASLSELLATLDRKLSNAERNLANGARVAPLPTISPAAREDRERSQVKLVSPEVVRASAQAAKRSPADAIAALNSALTGPERKILTALVANGPCSKRKLALLAGYSENGGGFNNPLGKLRSKGYVVKGDPIAATDEGVDALGDYEPLPTGQDLLDFWVHSPVVTGPMAKILSVIAEHHPIQLTKGDLAEHCGYSSNGGGFNNPLGRLRTLGLVNKGTSIGLTDEFAEAAFG